jgi:hypothetical protein
MTFSEDYGHLLSPFLKEYKAANKGKDKKAVIQNAANAISSSSSLLEDKGLGLTKNLKTVCLFFFFQSFFFWNFDTFPPFLLNFHFKRPYLATWKGG